MNGNYGLAFIKGLIEYEMRADSIKTLKYEGEIEIFRNTNVERSTLSLPI